MKIKQTKYSANTAWSNMKYKVRNVITGLPVVTTDSLNMGFSLNAEIVGTIVSSASDIIQYGFVWATTTSPTLDDNVVVVGSSNYIGEFNEEIFSLDHAVIYFRAFATNSVGTAYGEELEGESFLCLAQGTEVKTLYGNKNIEDINYNDDLLVWDFDNAKFNSAKPIWIMKPFTTNSQAVATFSDGSQLITIDDSKGHRIYNVKTGSFTHLMETPIGTRTFTKNGNTIRLVKKEIIKQKNTFFNVITNYHFNLFANGILTSTGLNNLYPIHNMKFSKTQKTNNLQKFSVSNEMFKGLRLSEQPSNYPNLNTKLIKMMNKQIPFTNNNQ